MRTLMMTCLVAANRARVLDTDQGRRVEQLLLNPNFVLLIKRHMESRGGEPLLETIPKALDIIIAREGERSAETAADLRLARELLQALV